MAKKNITLSHEVINLLIYLCSSVFICGYKVVYRF